MNRPLAYLKVNGLAFLRGLARRAVGEYYLFKIFYCDLTSVAPPTADGFSVFSEPNDGKREGYSGPQSFGFRVEEGGVELCRCWAWFGNQYRSRNFWPLGEHEAKVIALETLPEARGRGIATALLRYSAGELARRGFTRLYSRIWHSNTASIRAFEKAGWRYHALVVEFDLFRRRRRLVFRK